MGQNVNNNFENNWRRKQEIKMRPAADGIYKSIFGDGIEIVRFDNEYILDQKFAIDVQLRVDCGFILVGQEKFLTIQNRGFRSVTVEYLQNPITEEHGDWFKLGVQFYFTGYSTADSSGFDPWIILNWPQVVIETHKGNIRWMDNKNTHDFARASFRYCFMDSVPVSCVIAKFPPTLPR